MNFFKFQVSLMLALSLFLTTVVPSNVQASVAEDYKMEVTANAKRLDDIFDRFYYSMNVEWDQQDMNFIVQAQKDLKEELANSGISADEIQKYVEKTILGGKGGKEFSRLVDAMKAQKMSPEEVAKVTSKFLENNYLQGSNFNGEIPVKAFPDFGFITLCCIVVVAVVVVVIVIKKDKNDDDNGTVVVVVT